MVYSHFLTFVSKLHSKIGLTAAHCTVQTPVWGPNMVHNQFLCGPKFYLQSAPNISPVYSYFNIIYIKTK